MISRCYERKSLRVFALVLPILAYLLTMGVRAQAILEPPFGLRWGDSPEKLISWSSKHSLDLTIFISGTEPELRVFRISPKTGTLPDSPASILEAKFLHGGLFEMTIHYTDPTASAEAMKTRFHTLKKQITENQGSLLPNQRRKMVEDKYVTITQSFHREQVKGVFLLITWTEIEDLLRKKKEARFSLIYRNDNFRAGLGSGAEEK